MDQVPEDVQMTPLNGVLKLLGVRMEPSTVTERRTVWVETWWTTEAPIADVWMYQRAKSTLMCPSICGGLITSIAIGLGQRRVGGRDKSFVIVTACGRCLVPGNIKSTLVSFGINERVGKAVPVMDTIGRLDVGSQAGI